jgi:hypothetical protein
MGYTRYYEVKNKLDPEKFKDYSKDCKAICDEITKEFGHGIASISGHGDPKFTDDIISFNGVGDLSYESFCLSTGSKGFDFTKTQRNPYDRHVLACLILAKEYFGDNIRISLDGENDDEEVYNLIRKLKRDNKIKSILDEDKVEDTI